MTRRTAVLRPARVRALRVAAPLLLVGVLALAPLRTGLEASMSTHMLVQMPLLAAAGFLFARALPARWRGALQRLAGGAVPLALAAMLASSYWMLPRALDAALVDPWVEAAKFASLPLLAGAPLALAWARLGPIGRGFVWTNFFSMLAVLGWLYIAAPVRICNGYLVDQQQAAGWLMVQLALLSFGGWLGALLVGSAPAASDERPAVANENPSAAGGGNARTHPA
ncbi:MAG: hypothetical protein KJ011_13325 [Burkholderiaceae bacterium]|nr:hypothetical protein [Burkholderiaceae bacterium]